MLILDINKTHIHNKTLLQEIKHHIFEVCEHQIKFFLQKDNENFMIIYKARIKC